MKININIEVHNSNELNNVLQSLGSLQWDATQAVQTAPTAKPEVVKAEAEAPKKRAKKEAIPVPQATPKAEMKTVQVEQESTKVDEPKKEQAPAHPQADPVPDEGAMDDNGNLITDYDSQVRPVLMQCVREGFGSDGAAFKDWLKKEFGVVKGQDVAKDRLGELYLKAKAKIEDANDLL